MRKLSLAIILVVAVLAAPASAAEFTAHAAHWSLRMDTTGSDVFYLGLDRYYGASSAEFDLACGRRRHGRRPGKVSHWSPEMRERTHFGHIARSWNPQQRWCRLKRKLPGDARFRRVARFHLARVS